MTQNRHTYFNADTALTVASFLLERTNVSSNLLAPLLSEPFARPEFEIRECFLHFYIPSTNDRF